MPVNCHIDTNHFPIFLFSQCINMCSDKHHSNWATLHWKKKKIPRQYGKIKRSKLNLFVYSKLSLSLSCLHHHTCAFPSCHSKLASFESKIRCKTEHLHHRTVSFADWPKLCTPDLYLISENLNCFMFNSCLSSFRVSQGTNIVFLQTWTHIIYLDTLTF